MHSQPAPADALTLLLVEDNPADADLVEELLGSSSSGYEIRRATRLSDVRSAVQAWRPQCILLDLGLPDSQGLETLAEVRAAESNAAIVVITGRDDERLGLSALQQGAQDYLMKGKVDEGTLRRAIRYAVERKKLDAAKSQFIARAAHELRTPLAVLAGLGETLARSFDNLDRDQIDKTLEALERQGHRARVLVNNLLDLSQIEMGHLPVELSPVPLRPLVNDVLRIRGNDDPEVQVDVPDDLVIVADADRLEQLLVNLLTNAFKYGGPNVWVRGRRDGAAATIVVEDDGTGVPQDVLPRLFEAFARGTNTTAREGAGLGLAIARGLAERCGGDLRYEERQPRGARFIVTLGAQDPDADTFAR